VFVFYYKHFVPKGTFLNINCKPINERCKKITKKICGTFFKPVPQIKVEKKKEHKIQYVRQKYL